MGQIKNLKGQKFGKLTVLKLAHVKKRAYWLCECDCGNETIVEGRQLLKKGQNKTRSCGCLALTNLPLKGSLPGEKHFNWKGDKVGYVGLHRRLKRRMKKPKKCDFCKQEKKLDLANKSGRYSPKEEDWMWLCRGCHHRYDRKWIWKEDKWFKLCKTCKKVLEVSTKFFQKTTQTTKTNNWMHSCRECYPKRYRRK